MSEQPSAKKPDKRMSAILMAAGVVLGIFALLFAMANNDWVIISIPNPPWKTEPSLAAFEARLWATMLVCFAVGAVFAGVITAVVYIKHRKKAVGEIIKLKELETEIKNLSRLLDASVSGHLLEDRNIGSREITGGSDER
jgi:uncharacterized membrane protein YciS (DUF1049 family)